MATKSYGEKNMVCCMHCKNATFMQWFENPVIAQCRIRRVREVALAMRLCPEYQPSGDANPPVEHFDSYIN